MVDKKDFEPFNKFTIFGDSDAMVYKKTKQGVEFYIKKGGESSKMFFTWSAIERNPDDFVLEKKGDEI